MLQMTRAGRAGEDPSPPTYLRVPLGGRPEPYLIGWGAGDLLPGVGCHSTALPP